MADTAFTIEMPTEGQVIKILNEKYFVVGAGKHPGTVRLHAPFKGGQYSTRTVNWARFMQERIKVL